MFTAQNQAIMKNFLLLLMFYNALLVVSSQKLTPLEILGFQSWEQPSSEQIIQQYRKLKEVYLEKMTTSPNNQVKQKYQQINKAYQQLRNQNFKTDSNYDQKTHYQNSQRNANRYRNQNSNTYTYTTDQLDLQQLFRDLNTNFFHFDSDSQAHEQQQSKPIKVSISLPDFIEWMWVNPMIIIAAILISLGLLNICKTCCCCCCGQKKKQSSKTKNYKYKQYDPLQKYKRKGARIY